MGPSAAIASATMAAVAWQVYAKKGFFYDGRELTRRVYEELIVAAVGHFTLEGHNCQD
jgi:hypothetical protein